MISRAEKKSGGEVLQSMPGHLLEKVDFRALTVIIIQYP